MAYQLPFFKNYPADWLLSEKIAAMNLAEVGAYKLLIDHQWMGVACTLPDDVARLKTLARWHDEQHGDFSRVLACFPKCRRPRDRRANPRLLEEYTQAMASQAIAVTNGQKGAEKRWAKRERPSKPLRISPGADFEQFWDAYPRKEGKIAAEKAWTNATTKPSVADMLPVIERSKHTEQWTKDKGKYIPHPATWLNKGHWSDQPMANGHSKAQPPPFPPKTDPIARGQWRTAYGDPKQYGYE